MAEKYYYDNKSNVQVTNARAILDGKTFAMSNITSVSMEKLPLQVGCPAALVFLGFCIGSLAFTGMTSRGIPLLIALVVVGLGVALFTRLKPTYAVKIGSASGETTGMTSKDRAEVEKIVAAMNQAIIERG